MTVTTGKLSREYAYLTSFRDSREPTATPPPQKTAQKTQTASTKNTTPLFL